MSTITVATFPEEGADAPADVSFNAVRKRLSDPETLLDLKGLLRAKDARALVVTPEYDSWRSGEATGVVFHVLFNRPHDDDSVVNTLSAAFEKAAGNEGRMEVVDREKFRDLKQDFPGSRLENPLNEIIKELGLQTSVAAPQKTL